MRLSDKIIDDQGNVKTFASGQDARLYYLDFAGNEKKYLLEGEGGAGGDIPTALSQLENDANFTQMEFVSPTWGAFRLTSNTFYTLKTKQVGNINYTFDGTIKNAVIVFKTAGTINYTFSFSEEILVNKPIELEPNTWYIFTQDLTTVVWSKLEALV